MDNIEYVLDLQFDNKNNKLPRCYRELVLENRIHLDKIKEYITQISRSKYVEKECIIELYVENVWSLENQVGNRYSEKDSIKLKNIRETCSNIFLADETIEVSMDSIKAIHAKLMNSLLSDAGKFRKVNVMSHGCLTTYANYMAIERKLNALLNTTSEALHNNNNNNFGSQIIIAAVFLEQFLLIHPFSNGNGRTARILFSLLLKQSSSNFVLPVSLHKLVCHTYEQSRSFYIEALERSRSENIEDKLFIINYILRSMRSFYYDLYYIYS